MLKTQIDLLEDNEKELAKKNASSLKIIRLLTEKCRNQEMIIAQYDNKINELSQKDDEYKQTIEELFTKL